MAGSVPVLLAAIAGVVALSSSSESLRVGAQLAMRLFESAEETPVESAPANVALQVAVRMRERAASARKGANVKLVFFVAFSLSGISMLVWLSSTSQASLLRKETDKAAAAREENSRLLDWIQRAEAERVVQQRRYVERLLLLETRLALGRDSAAVASGSLGYLVPKVVPEVESDPPPRSPDWGKQRGSANTLLSLIGGITLRAGAVVLVLFLLQALVGIYRYDVRLAALLEARADAIEWATFNGSWDAKTLAELAQSLSPDHLDFGRTKGPTFREGIDLVEQLLGLRAKAAGTPGNG